MERQNFCFLWNDEAIMVALTPDQLRLLDWLDRLDILHVRFSYRPTEEPEEI